MIEGYIPKEFQRTFKGFPLDGTATFEEHEKRVKRIVARRNFYPKSRGMAWLKKELIEILENSMETDYQWNGEDEMPVDFLDTHLATHAILRFLKRHKVFHLLKQKNECNKKPR